MVMMMMMMMMMCSARSDAHDLADPTSSKPQDPLALQWRERSRRRMPRGGRDWIRNRDEALWCDMISLSPALRLPWRYTKEQESSKRTWHCTAVWLHCAFMGNGEHAQDDGTLYSDLLAVLNGIRGTRRVRSSRCW